MIIELPISTKIIGGGGPCVKFNPTKNDQFVSLEPPAKMCAAAIDMIVAADVNGGIGTETTFPGG